VTNAFSVDDRPLLYPDNLYWSFRLSQRSADGFFTRDFYFVTPAVTLSRWPPDVLQSLPGLPSEVREVLKAFVGLVQAAVYATYVLTTALVILSAGVFVVFYPYEFLRFAGGVVVAVITVVVAVWGLGFWPGLRLGAKASRPMQSDVVDLCARLCDAVYQDDIRVCSWPHCRLLSGLEQGHIPYGISEWRTSPPELDAVQRLRVLLAESAERRTLYVVFRGTHHNQNWRINFDVLETGASTAIPGASGNLHGGFARAATLFADSVPFFFEQVS
jgi:hypothetical protein